MRDHVGQAQGLAACGNPIRLLPQGLSLSHHSSGSRHILAISPDPKSLCVYVKSPEGKADKRELRKAVSDQEKFVNTVRQAVARQDGDIVRQAALIKSIKKEWTEEKRKIKLEA